MQYIRLLYIKIKERNIYLKQIRYSDVLDSRVGYCPLGFNESIFFKDDKTVQKSPNKEDLDDDSVIVGEMLEIDAGI